MDGWASSGKEKINPPIIFLEHLNGLIVFPLKLTLRATACYFTISSFEDVPTANPRVSSS